jgi:SAM-dependent methyltransferase
MDRMEPEGSTDPPWYRNWFGEEYLRLYPHRDREEAQEAVELLLEWAEGVLDGPVLDLACGAGRHLDALAQAGVNCIGLDLSLPLLQRACRAGPEKRLVRGDMRHLPFSDSSFAGVTSFFTSFGYFESAADDEQVLTEIRRVLRSDGVFLLDFLNADAVIQHLTPRDERWVGTDRVIQERRLLPGNEVVEKTIRIESAKEGKVVREFKERVRLYRPRELERLLGESSLNPVSQAGDYQGNPYSAESPRVIFLATAS